MGIAVCTRSAGPIHILTSRIRCTAVWTLDETAFGAPCGRRAGDGAVVRTPSMKFDNSVRGRVRIHALQIIRLNQARTSV